MIDTRRVSFQKTLTCPRCAREVPSTFTPESLRSWVECYRHGCEQHWWAMALRRGPLEPQLAAVFGAELAPALMAEWPIPSVLPTNGYLQLSVSRNQFREYVGVGARAMLYKLYSQLTCPTRTPQVSSS